MDFQQICAQNLREIIDVCAREKVLYHRLQLWENGNKNKSVVYFN